MKSTIAIAACSAFGLMIAVNLAVVSPASAAQTTSISNTKKPPGIQTTRGDDDSACANKGVLNGNAAVSKPGNASDAHTNCSRVKGESDQAIPTKACTREKAKGETCR